MTINAMLDAREGGYTLDFTGQSFYLANQLSEVDNWRIGCQAISEANRIARPELSGSKRSVPANQQPVARGQRAEGWVAGKWETRA